MLSVAAAPCTQYATCVKQTALCLDEPACTGEATAAPDTSNAGSLFLFSRGGQGGHALSADESVLPVFSR